MNPATEAGKAAELVCFALQPKVARGADDRYGELWTEYRTDESFRDIVDAVADGLGLAVIDASEQGLVVAPMDKSPFTYRMADYATGTTPKRRMLTGLIHLGIAALAYPREADLEDDIVVRRGPEQVERFLRDACQVLADAEEKDPVAGDEEEEAEAWREYLSMPESKRMAKGGFSIDCTMGLITRAFDWLVTQGMARQAGSTYQLLDRYRVQIRELAGHAALERLRALAADASLAEIAPEESSINNPSDGAPGATTGEPAPDDVDDEGLLADVGAGEES
jgi:hypothetical protein